MTNQTHEAVAYIEQEYDVKRRVELQRHVLAQLHMIEADASEAEASLNALLEDEELKLRILDNLRKWRVGKSEEMPANSAWLQPTSHDHAKSHGMAQRLMPPAS